LLLDSWFGRVSVGLRLRYTDGMQTVAGLRLPHAIEVHRSTSTPEGAALDGPVDHPLFSYPVFREPAGGGCSGTEFRLNRAPSLGVVIYAGPLATSRGMRRFFSGAFAQPGGVAVGAIDTLPNREGPWQPTPPCFGPSLVPGRDRGPKAQRPNPGAGYGTPPTDSRKSFFFPRIASDRRARSRLKRRKSQALLGSRR
jgi:hypothetical protein